jgi:hypothetical protein
MDFLDESQVEPTGRRRELVLREPRLRHYDEFAVFLRHHFSLTAEDAERGRRVYLKTDAGRLYELAFLAGTGGPYPSGLTISLLVEGVEPMPSTDEIDADVWAFLRWLAEGAGGEWTPDRVDRLGRLYNLPFAARE